MFVLSLKPILTDACKFELISISRIDYLKKMIPFGLWKVRVGKW